MIRGKYANFLFTKPSSPTTFDLQKFLFRNPNTYLIETNMYYVGEIKETKMSTTKIVARM